MLTFGNSVSPLIATFEGSTLVGLGIGEGAVIATGCLTSAAPSGIESAFEKMRLPHPFYPKQAAAVAAPERESL